MNFNAMLRANQLPVNDLAYFRPGTNYNLLLRLKKTITAVN